MRVLIENIPEELRAPEVGLTSCLEAFGVALPVQQVLLFGSYARGAQLPGSDVDLCLVTEGAENQVEAAHRFRRSIRDIRPKPPMTLIPITPERLREKTSDGDFFFKTIIDEGICVAAKD
ncbi:MAG TPA: nucleotidyltransferase domain-containing protein [Kiritimatiellia bacterium]|nr:nucleotidyltransferase domain-containing protein [Kiritimatiellia bacterium]